MAKNSFVAEVTFKDVMNRLSITGFENCLFLIVELLEPFVCEILIYQNLSSNQIFDAA